MICIIEDEISPDSKVHGANMGPIWGRQDPGGPHIGPMNFGRHFTDDIFRCIFINKKCMLIKISLKIVPKCPIDNNPALFQKMAWCHTGDELLYEPTLKQSIDAYRRHKGGLVKSMINCRSALFNHPVIRLYMCDFLRRKI